MGHVSSPQMTDGTTHTAAQHNNQINSVVNEFNGNIDDSNIKSGAAIDSGKIANGLSGMFGAWNSYAAAWTASTTNPTIGNGTLSASFIQVGKTVFARIGILAGSTTTFGSGIYSFSLPVSANSALTSGAFALNLPIGSCVLNGTSTPPGLVVIASSTTAKIIGLQTLTGSNPVNLTSSFISASGPLSWASGNSIVMQFSYEAA